MSQAQDYLINQALGKPVNPNGLNIKQVPVPKGQARKWRFPDGSMMTEDKPESGKLLVLDEIK